MELVDIYNELGEKTGLTCDRNDELEPKQYRLIVTIWTVNKNKELLITQRSSDKDFYGNYWECTGGAVGAGEQSLDSAQRELLEETGLHAEKEQLILFDSRMIGQCIHHSYLYRYDFNLDEIVLQDGETVAADKVSLNRLEELYKENKFIPILWPTYDNETKQKIFK